MRKIKLLVDEEIERRIANDPHTRREVKAGEYLYCEDGIWEDEDVTLRMIRSNFGVTTTNTTDCLFSFSVKQESIKDLHNG